MNTLNPVIVWLLVLVVLAVLGVLVLIITGRLHRRRELDGQTSAVARHAPAAEPQPTGYYLRGRVRTLIEGRAIVEITGPGNGGQALDIPDDGTYAVGDRVNLQHHDDDTWRPVRTSAGS